MLIRISEIHHQNLTNKMLSYKKRCRIHYDEKTMLAMLLLLKLRLRLNAKKINS